MSKAMDLQIKLKPLIEMANLRTKETGLDVGVYISTKQGSHSARVKIYPMNKFGVSSLAYHFTVDNDPEIVVKPKDDWLSKEQISNVKYWIWLNRVDLLKLWNLNPYTVPYEDISNLINNLTKVNKRNKL